MTYAEYARALRGLAQTAPSPEWKVIMNFYAAVHATNSVLYTEGNAPLSHRAHERQLNAHPVLSALSVEYEELRGLSEDARYRPQIHPLAAADIDLSDRLADVLLAACNV